MLAVALPDGRTRQIEIDQPTPAELRTYANWLGLWTRMEADGHTDSLGEGVSVDTAVLSLRDPFKRTKLQNTLNAMLGSDAGFDGSVLRGEDYDRIGFYVNYLGAGKGDAQIGDVDKAAAVARRERLGIHPEGDPQVIDYAVLGAACRFMDGQKYLGAPDYDALQAHLHRLFPKAVDDPDAETALEVLPDLAA